MLLLDDESAWKRAWAYKDHGKDWDAMRPGEKPAGFPWVHGSFGTNWRMTEMQAAIGRVQLRKLDHWVAQRRSNAGYLAERLHGIHGVEIAIPGRDFFHSYYKFYLALDSSSMKEGCTRDRIVEEVSATGMPCLAGICPEMYRERAFTAAGLGPASPLPVAGELGGRSMLLLVHPTIATDELRTYADAVEEVLLKFLKKPAGGDVR